MAIYLNIASSKTTRLTFFQIHRHTFRPISTNYEKFSLLVDINAEDTESSLFGFLEQYAAKNIMKEKNCFKNPYSSIHIDIFLNSNKHSFQNTLTISIGMSHFHKMVITI